MTVSPAKYVSVMKAIDVLWCVDTCSVRQEG
jgi:hypothetical protein